MEKIIIISDRGQITIPKKIRNQVPALSFTCSVFEGRIVLKPLYIMNNHETIIRPQSTSPLPTDSWSDISS